MTAAYMHIATRPFDFIAAHNRFCAAIGATLGAAYNGHRYSVCHTVRGSYQTSYVWSGTRYVYRGTSIVDAARAALTAFDKGALGASVELDARAATAAEVAELRAMGFVDGELPHVTDEPWWTWRHDAARDAARPQGRYLAMDAALMADAASLREYEDAYQERHGKRAWS